jgi:hypothetical protein
MAQRYLPFAALLLLSACGGRETGDSPSGTGTGGGGGAVTVGTGGSGGTSSTTTGEGGSSTAGQSGTGGSGQGGNDFSACTPMDSCVLEPVGACGPGCEPVPLSAFTAINSSQMEAYSRSRPPVPCLAIACAPSPPGVATSQNYYAVCQSGTCEPVDVRMTTLSVCASDDDCYLRAGTTCCGCGNDNLIAVSKRVNVEQVFCGAGHACAADCVSAPLPPGVRAYCSGGHCLVRYPGPDGG